VESERIRLTLGEVSADGRPTEKVFRDAGTAQSEEVTTGEMDGRCPNDLKGRFSAFLTSHCKGNRSFSSVKGKSGADGQASEVPLPSNGDEGEEGGRFGEKEWNRGLKRVRGGLPETSRETLKKEFGQKKSSRKRSRQRNRDRDPTL